MHRARSSKREETRAAGFSARGTLGAVAAITLVCLAAYCNSFRGPFVYDDRQSILENPTIHRLWALSQVLSPPPDGRTVSGRPVINLSLAINYALGRTDVWGYHAVNLAIHVLAAWALFGIVRRTLASPGLAGRFAGAATGLGLATAAIWAVHPLQTESVTYTIQRSESIMGLFFLLCLYCVIRGAGSHRGVWWHIGAVAACGLGMGSKEVMVGAPLIALLYDRTFLAGSFKVAFRRRWGLYVGLAATWVILAALVISAGDRGKSVDFGRGIGAFRYAVTQPGVILHYLRLSFWPDPLCLDYGWRVAKTAAEIVPGAVVVGALLAATVWALLRRPALGFVGAWFFLILAPSSSIIPIVTEVAAEHRMYLPLAGLVVMAVIGGYAALAGAAGRAPPGLGRWIGAVLVTGVIGALAWTTARRNEDYRSGVSIWRAVVETAPNNAGGHYNLAMDLALAGRRDEAVGHHRRAIELVPTYGNAHNNLALLLADQGKADEAVFHLREAIRHVPDLAMAHSNLGKVLASQGRWDEAIGHLREAIRLKGDLAEAHINLGSVLAQRGRADEAIAHLRRAIQLEPDNATAHNNLANALAAKGSVEEAIAHYRRALQIDPDDAGAHNNLGVALASRGKLDEAIRHYRRAIQLEPDYADAQINLAIALSAKGKRDEAIRHFRKGLQVSPRDAEAHYKLANLLVAGGKPAEAIGHYEQALRVRPGHPAAHYNLGMTLAKTARITDGLAHLRRAGELEPNWPAPSNLLARILATHPDPNVRDGRTAVRLAERACALTKSRDPTALDTLAAAYAETGQYDRAVTTIQTAIEIATAAKAEPLAARLRKRLELYKREKPYRAPGPTSTSRRSAPREEAGPGTSEGDRSTPQ